MLQQSIGATLREKSKDEDFLFILHVENKVEVSNVFDVAYMATGMADSQLYSRHFDFILILVTLFLSF